jgi:hypothetical protein
MRRDLRPASVSYNTETEAAAMQALNLTQRTYRTLDDAYRFFNERLFGGELPTCLITIALFRGDIN